MCKTDYKLKYWWVVKVFIYCNSWSFNEKGACDWGVGRTGPEFGFNW